jgi:hypothetical protein
MWTPWPDAINRELSRCLLSSGRDVSGAGDIAEKNAESYPGLSRQAKRGCARLASWTAR